MGIISVSCDKCQKVLSITDAHPTFDGQYYCSEHFLDYEIATLELEYLAKQKWLKETHLADLDKMALELQKLNNLRRIYVFTNLH